MQRRNYGLLATMGLLLIATLWGCGGKESGTVMTAEQVSGETQPLTFKTADGWTLGGDIYPPKEATRGVVLFFHQRGGSADDWHALATAVQQAGYLGVAIDARGTGRSTQGPGQSGELAPWDTSNDIAAAVYGFKDKGPIVLVGASYGANNALIYAGAHPDQIHCLVLLSPSTNYHDLKTTDAVKAYTGPMLIFHQKDDKIAGNGPEKLNSMAASKDHQLIVNDGAGHGTALLNANTTQQTVDFLNRTLK